MAQAKKIYTGFGAIAEPPVIKISEGKVTEKTVSEMHGYLREIADKVNFGFSRGTFLPNESLGSTDGQCVHVVFPGAPNTPVEVYHELGRIPKIYKPVRKNDYCDIKDAKSAEWTATKIWLQCDTADAEVILELE